MQTTRSKIIDPNNPGFMPRIVSIYELREKLSSYLAGNKWAADALMDLWRMGAPDPSPYHQLCQPGICKENRIYNIRECGALGCKRERRVLLPEQFAQWWRDVAARQGVELTAGEALDDK